MRVTNARLIADVRRVAKELGHAPTCAEYVSIGKHSKDTIVHQLGGGKWHAAIAACGLLYTSKRGRWRIPTTDELKKDLLRVEQSVGHMPTYSDYVRFGKFAAETFTKRANCKRWEDAVAFIADVDKERVKQNRRHGRGAYHTNDELLNALRAVCTQLGRVPNSSEIVRYGIPRTVLVRRFGGWDEAVKAAGVSPEAKTQAARARTATDDEVLADVLKVARMFGRPPEQLEYQKYGLYGLFTIRRRFGKWKPLMKLIEDKLARPASVLPHVHDPVRDKLKSESVANITEFFRKRLSVNTSAKREEVTDKIE